MTRPDPGPDPSDAARRHLADALERHRAGDLDGAVTAYRALLDRFPDHVVAWTNLGAALRAQGHADEAMRAYARAEAIDPDAGPLHLNRANLLADLGRNEDAVAAYEVASRRIPNAPDPRAGLSGALLGLDRTAEALAVAAAGLRLWPESTALLHALGAALLADGQVGAAERAFTQAIATAPGVAAHHMNRSLTRRAAGRHLEALEDLAAALARDPDLVAARWERAITRLLLGDYDGGFADYEVRRALPQDRVIQIDAPVWDGSPMPGRTLLVHPEQGFGDSLMFVRYLPMVRARLGPDAKLVVVVQPEFARLFPAIPEAGVDRWVPVTSPYPAADAKIAKMSLPRLFGTTLETVPARTPYLRAPEDARAGTAAAQVAEARDVTRVGIAWSGRPTNSFNVARTVTLPRLLGCLLPRPELVLFSLQKGAAGSEVQSLLARRDPALGAGLRDLGPVIRDFADTAAVVERLDLVITVDTAVAHLAGALAVPTWVLLPWIPPWQWLLDRPDSPWYPTARLFRQPAPGDWDSVFADLEDALDALMTDRGPGR